MSLNENIVVEVVLELSSIPVSARKKVERLLSPIALDSGKDYIIFPYQNDREWREQHLNILRELYKLYRQIRESGGRTPFFCGCRYPKRKIELSLAKSGELYHFKTYKEQTANHSPECHFYDEPVDTEKIWERWKGKKLSISMLDVPKSPNQSVASERDELKRPLTKSNQPRMTFSRMMVSLTDEAYGWAFNGLNVGIDRLAQAEKLTLPTNSDVVVRLRKLLSQRIPKSYEVFINLLSPGEIKVEGDSVIFPFGRKISKRQVFGWDLDERGYASSIGNFLNINIFHKRKRIITRAFFLPLLYSQEDKPFIPIESKNEAKVIEKFLSDGKKVFKVLTGSIAKKYAKLGYPTCITSILLRLTYYPDLILFENPLKVVEIMGLESENYKALKRRIEREFKLLRSSDCPVEYLKV